MKSCLYVLAFLVLSGCGADTAMNCVTKRYDSGWSQLVFYNTCNQNINFRICYKFGMAEIGALFSGEQAQWKCRIAQSGKGRITSIIWSGEQSSGLAVAFSASRYVSAACYVPKTPRFTKNNKFVCK